MYANPPIGETPPAPGLEREEPELVLEEEDIPSEDETRHETEAALEDHEDLREVERE